MSVADHFGLDDPTSPLLARARAAWRDWRTRYVEMVVIDDLQDLRDWTRRVPYADKEPVLARLAALAETDDAARIALVWLLIPGATALADRLRDLSPEIDELVAGQLWIEVARSHHLGPRGIAKAILNETRRQVTAELGVGHQARLRDKVWAEIRLLERFEEQAVLVEPPGEDPYDELLQLLDAALRDEAISGFDLWLLYEPATEASAAAAPMRRGRCGLTSPAVVELVARKRPEAPRTLRRRVGNVLDELAAYAEALLDDESLARWRDAHPWQSPTWKAEAAALIAEEEAAEEYVRTRCPGTGSALGDVTRTGPGLSA